MTDEEVNIIIAKFMGLKIFKVYDYGIRVYENRNDTIPKQTNSCYTKSLDALVPVWEKIGKMPKLTYNGVDYFATLQLPEYDLMEHSNISIHKAAAHATAKAIKELNNE